MTNYNDGKWHGWNGGACPVHPRTLVDVALLNGVTARKVKAGNVAPSHWTDNDDPPRHWTDNIVIAFRVVKEYREPREWWCVGLHMHETKEEAEEFLSRLNGSYPDMDFGPVYRVREVTDEGANA